MNFRNLLFAFVTALGISSALLWVGGKLSFGKVEITAGDQSTFRTDTLKKLNSVRFDRGLMDVANDQDVQSWLATALDNYNFASGETGLQNLLNDLPTKVPALSSASIRSLNAKAMEDLNEQIDFWTEAYRPETSIIATHLYPEEKGRIGCVLIAANRVPDFDIALLNDGVTEFYNVCRHCEEPHIGKLSKVDLALAVSCPRCRKGYDLLAIDMLGTYHRANQFLEGMRPPPGVGSDATNRHEEMMAIWSAVLERCRYAKDLSGLKGEKDTWQRPSETFDFRNGDCEDTALLLTDWLLSRGFNARVAIGETVGIGGHAWTVVELEGRQYCLETTIGKVPKAAPETITVADRYRPQFLFDRRNIYFFDSKLTDVTEYFSSDHWIALAYEPSKTPPPVAISPEAP